MGIRWGTAPSKAECEEADGGSARKEACEADGGSTQREMHVKKTSTESGTRAEGITIEGHTQRHRRSKETHGRYSDAWRCWSERFSNPREHAKAASRPSRWALAMRGAPNMPEHGGRMGGPWSPLLPPSMVVGFGASRAHDRRGRGPVASSSSPSSSSTMASFDAIKRATGMGGGPWPPLPFFLLSLLPPSVFFFPLSCLSP